MTITTAATARATVTPRLARAAVDTQGSGADRAAMIHECAMTEDCPGYDRDRRVCLVRPDDCEFAPASAEAALAVEAADELTPDAGGEAASRSR